MNARIVVRAVAAGAMLLWGTASFAGVISCGTPRTASLGPADACVTAGPVTGTPQASDVLNAYPGTPWQGVGNVSMANGTNGFLTVDVTSGSWGADASGTWAIDPLFWANFGEAVITIHAGNGSPTDAGQNPDWWFFLVTPGSLSGTFTYSANGNGGGLSNLFLWGRGTPELDVPEPATLGLLGLGLVGLGFRRRKAG